MCVKLERMDARQVCEILKAVSAASPAASAADSNAMGTAGHRCRLRHMPKHHRQAERDICGAGLGEGRCGHVTQRRDQDYPNFLDNPGACETVILQEDRRCGRSRPGRVHHHAPR